MALQLLSRRVKLNGATGQESNLDYVVRMIRKGGWPLASRNLKL